MFARTAKTQTGSGSTSTDARRIGLICQSQGLADCLQKALSAYPSFVVSKISASNDRGHDVALAASDVVLIEIDVDRAGAMNTIEGLHAGGFEGAIISLSTTLDEDAIRKLLRWGVKDWLPTDAAPEAIIAACEAAISGRNISRNGEVACIAFIPAAGGVGNTTVAVETAFQLGRSGRKLDRTCLVDLNFQSGALADFLELEPLFDLKAIAETPERLDTRLLEVMLARHASGLAVLAAPRSPAECASVDPDLIVRVLDTVAQMFDVLLIDMPPMWMPYSEPVARGCDCVFVITEPSIPALRRARDLADALPDKLSEGARVRVIVNKWRREFLGEALRKRDVETVLNGYLAGFLPEEAGLVREAINSGQHLSALSRSNRISRELARIVSAEAMLGVG